MDFTPEAVVAARPSVPEWKGEHVRWAEIKRDGHRMTVIIDRVGQAFARGRKPTLEMVHELKRTPELKRFIESLPPATIVDMEVCGQSRFSTDVVTSIKSGCATFEVIALPYYHGVDILNREGRWSSDLSLFAATHGVKTSFSEKQLVREDFAKQSQFLKRYARDHKIEGFVVKNQLWSQWYKVKPVRRGDFIVIGKSQRVFYHDLKALSLAYIDRESGRLVEIGEVGSGFTLLQRKEYWASAPRVVEVEFDSVNARGKLRFPTFIRVRDDEKDVGECHGDELR